MSTNRYFLFKGFYNCLYPFSRCRVKARWRFSSSDDVLLRTECLNLTVLRDRKLECGLFPKVTSSFMRLILPGFVLRISFSRIQQGNCSSEESVSPSCVQNAGLQLWPVSGVTRRLLQCCSSPIVLQVSNWWFQYKCSGLHEKVYPHYVVTRERLSS